MKKLIFKLLLLLPILISMNLIIYTVDPTQIYHHQIEEDILMLISNGQNATGFTNYNERYLKKISIESFQKNIETMIIGSSRCLQVRADFFSTENFYNLCVSGARLEDLL